MQNAVSDFSKIARHIVLPPPFAALLLQGVAFFAALVCSFLSNQVGYTLTLVDLAFLSGLIATLLSRFYGLARWWIPIQLFFMPAVIGALSFDISPNWYLAAFLALLAVYWSTFRSQVPLYLSSNKVRQALEDLLPAASNEKNFHFMDIGSGMGGVLAHLAKARPDGQFFGVETAPLPFLLSWLRMKLGGYRNCRVQWRSLWTSDLSQYDIVFAYLSPAPMEQLWQKARNEMRNGTLFISNTFVVPSQPPQNTIALNDLHGSTLYIWHM